MNKVSVTAEKRENFVFGRNCRRINYYDLVLLLNISEKIRKNT